MFVEKYRGVRIAMNNIWINNRHLESSVAASKAVALICLLHQLLKCMMCVRACVRVCVLLTDVCCFTLFSCGCCRAGTDLVNKKQKLFVKLPLPSISRWV